MGETKIEWADYTFNPWVGCSKLSPACQHCYAEAWAKRSGMVKWGNSAERRKTSDANWRQPIKWDAEARRAGEIRRVFCASLADVGEDRPELKPWRKELMRLVAGTPNLLWLLLTKRPQNMPHLLSEASPRGSNYIVRKRIAIGTTVESQDYVRRIDYLMNCRAWAATLFLSCEPLLSGIDLFPWFHAVDDGGGHDYNMGIDWVIAGGESGGHARPSDPNWFRGLRDQCLDAKVPFHFKQWGEWQPLDHIDSAWWNSTGFDRNLDAQNVGDSTMYRVGKKIAGRLLDGREWNEFPSGVRAA